MQKLLDKIHEKYSQFMRSISTILVSNTNWSYTLNFQSLKKKPLTTENVIYMLGIYTS